MVKVLLFCFLEIYFLNEITVGGWRGAGLTDAKQLKMAVEIHQGDSCVTLTTRVQSLEPLLKLNKQCCCAHTCNPRIPRETWKVEIGGSWGSFSACFQEFTAQQRDAP